MLFYPFQLFTIATMLSPALWVAPPRPPDTPPPSRRATFGYKIAAGFALSQIYWLIPTTDHCSPDFLCFIFRKSQSLPALPAPRPIAPRSPAPTSRAYVSSLLRRSCPVVVIPPRPAPTCRNTHVHPTFEWAPQSPVPSPILAQPSCSLSSLPTIFGDESTYAHPSILPFSPPRPTDAAPIFSVLLLVACIICRNSLGNILAIVLVALMDLARSMVPVNVTRSSWRFKNVEHAARVLSGSVALGVIVLCYVVRGLSANYALFSAFVLGLTIETILAWTKEVVSDIWTSPPVVQKYTSIVTTNLESSNKVISTVEVQAPIVQAIDGSKDEIDIAPCTVLPSTAITPGPQPFANEDYTVSGLHQEDRMLESKLEPTLTVDDGVQHASESNSESRTVELPIVEVPEDATPNPQQLLEPLPAFFVDVTIPVSEVLSVHYHVPLAAEPQQDSPPVASPIIATTTITDVEVVVDEHELIPQPEPESLPSPSPVLVTPAGAGEVIPIDHAVSTPFPEQEQESEPSLVDIATSVIEQEPEHSLVDIATPAIDVGIIPHNVLVTLTSQSESVSSLVAIVPINDAQVHPAETAPLSSEEALQQGILTSVVDEACADDILAAPELSLAKYEIVPDGATSLENESESKQQDILEPLPAADGGLSEDPPIHPDTPTTGTSMTELTPYPPPLLVPSIPLLEASSSDYKSDSTQLPRIRRRVRRSLKRERKAEREAAEVVTAADDTAEASTQYHDDAPDWCLVVRGRGHGRR